jgi:hypothetical protein
MTSLQPAQPKREMAHGRTPKIKGHTLTIKLVKK